MIEGINTQGVGPKGVEPSARTRRLDAVAAAPGGRISPVASSPPAEVLEALDRAARVLEELAARDVRMSFQVDEDSGRIEVEISDGSGQVIRRVPSSEALELLASDGPGLVLNERG